MSCAFLLGCAADSPAQPRSGATGAPPSSILDSRLGAARAYLEEVLGAVRAEAFYADRIDWSSWEAEAETVASEASTVADTYGFVRRLVFALGDHHSQFFAPEDRPDLQQSTMAVAPWGQVDDSGIGLVHLPGIATADSGSDQARDYITAALHVFDAQACGWIVDLRGNGGGNLFPMLVALGPILGPGPTVGYRHHDGSTDVYELDDEGALIAPDGSVLAAPPAGSEITYVPGLPIAVLQGGSTASSGEGVLMALLGRPNVRTFGRPTAGLPTGNSLVEFTDGSAVNLTQAIGVDSAGVTHESAIPPQTPTGPSQDALDEAHAWLSSQPSCD